MTCPWCQRSFTPRTALAGGKPQAYCSPSCRRELRNAAHRWVLAEVAAGRLDMAHVREWAESNGRVATRGQVAVPAIQVAPKALKPVGRPSGGLTSASCEASKVGVIQVTPQMEAAE
jgi:hypothetical protein